MTVWLIAARWRNKSDQEVLAALHGLRQKVGVLNKAIIERASEVPKASQKREEYALSKRNASPSQNALLAGAIEERLSAVSRRFRRPNRRLNDPPWCFGAVATRRRNRADGWVKLSIL
jgi:hypothetical protein